MDDVCEKITDGTHNTPKYFDEGYIFHQKMLHQKKLIGKMLDTLMKNNIYKCRNEFHQKLVMFC